MAARRCLDVIASCIKQYHAGAKELYGDNAEDNSIVMLTILDLWMGLNRLAIQRHPLLKEYRREIRPEFLHDLFLYRPSDINRALHIEECLC
jgi:hypothetical protein